MPYYWYFDYLFIDEDFKCVILGNGINPNLQVGEEYTINVDTHEAGPGAVTGRIRSTLGNDLDLDIVDNEDGTFNLFYTPYNPGNYVIKVKFGGQDIPGGDFVVTVCFHQTQKKAKFPSLSTKLCYFFTKLTSYLDPSLFYIYKKAC